MNRRRVNLLTLADAVPHRSYILDNGLEQRVDRRTAVPAHLQELLECKCVEAGAKDRGAAVVFYKRRGGRRPAIHGYEQRKHTKEKLAHSFVVHQRPGHPSHSQDLNARDSIYALTSISAVS